MGLFWICLLLLCHSSLAQLNNCPKIHDPYFFVCEDTPPGSVAFTINATDPDGDELSYKLEGAGASYFRVDSTGTVYVTKTLDRENEELLNVRITVSDSECPDIENVVVVVNDANDNEPVFEQAQYEASVPEDTAVGTTLLTVLATDADDAKIITYTINGSVPNSGLEMFRIDRLGNIILNKSLDYSKLGNYYRLTVLASDPGGKCFFNETTYLSSSAFVFITVLDIPNLNPEFIGIPYVASVEEHSAIGHAVITVSAFDPDAGINDKIIYSLLDSPGAELFGIDANGVISVTGDIDRETIGETVNLIVKATEASLPTATATAAVRITIDDINDNKPEFYQCYDESNCVPSSSFSGEVLEHSLGAVFINMTVKDADQNAKTLLSLDGEGKNIFAVQPSEALSDTPVQLTIIKPEDLDYEKTQQLTLKVIAVDKDNTMLRSTADVTITILDANDHSPEFAQSTYYASVPEHCPDNTVVADIIATDPDTMDQGQITYSLLPVSILEYFGIENTTGRVFVKNGTLLDRETRSLYSVTIQARDSDNKPGSAVLDITITDINDKKPIPNRNTYQVLVPEGGNLEVPIEATDGDEPNTPNSQLVYTIEPGPYSMNFSIDPETGVLTNNGPLDREDIDPDLNGKISLTVNVSDKGNPPLSNVVHVIIDVQDINDNKPKFQKSFYNFTVKEGEKGAFVGSVYAEDEDQTAEFNRISFSIASGAFGSFGINSVADAPGYIGNIRVDQDIELDYEGEQKIFNLDVVAADVAQEKNNVTVEIHVLDVNDERPRFRPIDPVDVDENSKDLEPIGKFEAIDDDTNSSLVYELVSVTCVCGEEERPCDWFIVEPNGDVKVNATATIDYEACKQAIVIAQVTDVNTEKGESNSASPGVMEINIQDVNDNTPEFIDSNSVFVVVSESANKDTSVAGVSATDRDSGANARIEFDVTKVQFINMNGESTNNDGLFVAITTQQGDIYVGIIQLTGALNTKLQGKYVVTVEARDTGGLTNSTELEIFVIDDQYKNELKFRAPLAEIKQNEGDIRRDLTVSTQAGVTVTDIREETSETARLLRASDTTIMDAYFVFGNGTALAPQTVENILSEPDNYALLSQYSLIYVGSGNLGEPETKPEVYVLFGIVGGLVIVSAVLSTSLFCTRRNYRRKLKAADAMKSASYVMSENQKGGPVVPGTNLYTMEGANPVLNLNIDSAIALDLGEDSDVDKISFNSLDNSDMAVMEKDTERIMRKTRDDDGDNDSGLPEHIEPLGAALAQRDQRIRSNNPLLGEANPIFDTTDL